MGSEYDVFGNLNKFLDKADDSFHYDSFATTPNTSALIHQSTKNTEESWGDIIFEAPKDSERKAKKRGSDESSPVPDESFDLTDGSFEISPRKRSRRAADEIQAKVIDSIELFGDSQASEDLNDSGMTTRSRRSQGKKGPSTPPPKKAAVKKAPKPKRMSYKQALALVKAPIPQPQGERSQAKQVKQPAPRRVPLGPPVECCDVDLTGDIVLTDKHSSAPLFQKSNEVKKNVVDVESSCDDDEDLLNFDVDVIKVKVKVNGVIKPYTFRRHQRYYDLIKTLSEQHNIPIGHIFLYDGDKRIQPDDTPNSTSYKITTFLACRVMVTKPGEYQLTSKKDQIELKFQSDKWKKPISVKISKFDVLKTALDVLCEKMPEFKPEQFSLQFDGDDISVTETPTDLEFEGGEILDCRVKV